MWNMFSPQQGNILSGFDTNKAVIDTTSSVTNTGLNAGNVALNKATLDINTKNYEISKKNYQINQQQLEIVRETLEINKHILHVTDEHLEENILSDILIEIKKNNENQKILMQQNAEIISLLQKIGGL